MSQMKISAEILASEADFFDREAEEELKNGDLMIPPEQLLRYQRAKRCPTNTPKESLFCQLNPLAGKRVLDYGCGTGENAVLLAACGAEVTAFDISPGSIRAARRRAEMHGLSDKIQLDVLGAGQAPYAPQSFDIITGFAILHHLHMDLATVYAEIASLLKPGGSAYFIEPVANSAVLRALRTITPVPRDATPDERQLQYAEFEMMRAHGFRQIKYEHFYCLERLRRLFGWKIAMGLRRVDYAAQRALPFVRRYYGTVLVIAHK